MSVNYVDEIVSNVAVDIELDNILRKRGVVVIINDMDVHEWNPSTEKYIDVKYDSTTVKFLHESRRNRHRRLA